MSDSYNGWSNYETWCVNLWMSSDEGSAAYWEMIAQDIAECADDYVDSYPESFSLVEIAKYRLADRLRDEMQIPDDLEGLWRDLVGSALDEVDWSEIAESMLGEYVDILV